ncbi:hypothetical protein C8R45DRAFT_1075155 [Mycena sanguinolenta]|nr:hypothetical protein C8R45DRAFT_1075155 [Mycena sanguinolenta]
MTFSILARRYVLPRRCSWCQRWYAAGDKRYTPQMKSPYYYPEAIRWFAHAPEHISDNMQGIPLDPPAWYRQRQIRQVSLGMYLWRLWCYAVLCRAVKCYPVPACFPDVVLLLRTLTPPKSVERIEITAASHLHQANLEASGGFLLKGTEVNFPRREAEGNDEFEQKREKCHGTWNTYAASAAQGGKSTEMEQSQGMESMEGKVMVFITSAEGMIQVTLEGTEERFEERETGFEQK